jgi:hypothetical protein
MSETGETLPALGTPKDVLVRGMPAGVWEQVTAAAKQSEMTVAQFLVAYFARHGFEGVPLSAKLSDKPRQQVALRAPSVAPETDGLLVLVQAASLLSGKSERNTKAIRLARMLVIARLEAALSAGGIEHDAHRQQRDQPPGHDKQGRPFEQTDPSDAPTPDHAASRALSDGPARL